MADLQLYRVTVTQTWSAEAESLVLAESQLHAELAACRKIRLSDFDAKRDDTEAHAHQVPIDAATSLTKDQADDLYLLLPVHGSPIQWQEVKYEEFMRAFTPEELERARIARIERNNGQLAMLEIIHA